MSNKNIHSLVMIQRIMAIVDGEFFGSRTVERVKIDDVMHSAIYSGALAFNSLSPTIDLDLTRRSLNPMSAF